MVALHTSGQIAPVAVSSVFIVVIAVSVALRIYARRLKKLSLGIDDYLVLAAAVRESSHRWESQMLITCCRFSPMG